MIYHYTLTVNTDFYADDTTLYISGETLEIIQRNLQVALDCLAKWCKCNGMVINTTKTKVMLITTHQKRASLINGQLSLQLNDNELNMITNDKVLGIIIDHNLTWSQHVDKVCKKITTNLWLLARIKEFLAHLSRRLTGELIVCPCSGVRRPSSVVRRRPSSFTISKIFSSETAWPIKAKLHVEHP